MNSLYVKDNNGKFIPTSIEIVSANDLVDKLIVVSVGDDDEPTNENELQYIQKCLTDSEIISNAMKSSTSATLLLLSHRIKFQIVPKSDMITKNICVRIESKDDIGHFDEFKNYVKKNFKNGITIIPAPISLKEYEETKAISERIRLRKNKNNGGLNK